MPRKYRLTFALSAVQGLEEIRTWYADREIGEVGERMVRKVISAVERLVQFPESGRIVPEFGIVNMSSLRMKVLLTVLILLSTVPCFGWSGLCVSVQDGDSIKVMCRDHAMKIRLYGIDCPERGQPFGTRARQFTSSLVFKKVVEVEPITIDQHGRTVAWVTVEGKNVNKELLRAGLAWWSRRSAPHDRELANLEDAARKARVGLWSDPHPVPPWVWRKRSKP
ncbi:MAG: thermonuclease family protein [Thermodesulfobacteriota bacterium]